MSSGNPSKAVDDETVRQVRAGIRAGKSPVIPLSPSTRITITSTSENEAEFITRIIMANLKQESDDEVEAFLHALELYVSLYALDADNRAGINKTLTRVSRTVAKMK